MVGQEEGEARMGLYFVHAITRGNRFQLKPPSVGIEAEYSEGRNDFVQAAP